MNTERSTNCKLRGQVIVVGAGKLATELLATLKVAPGSLLVPWKDRRAADKAIVIHAGSGRELEAVIAYCTVTQSPLIELATGSKTTAATDAFPIVLCPNTNILMLKFMRMLEQSGQLFHGYQITIAESHQAQKTSVPGTAVDMAHVLGLKDHDVLSIRDANTQRAEWEIPEEDLARHACHRIMIQDGACSVRLETRVHGESPYADGVARIVAVVQDKCLENRLYPIMEFVGNGWL